MTSQEHVEKVSVRCWFMCLTEDTASSDLLFVLLKERGSVRSQSVDTLLTVWSAESFGDILNRVCDQDPDKMENLPLLSSARPSLVLNGISLKGSHSQRWM